MSKCVVVMMKPGSRERFESGLMDESAVWDYVDAMEATGLIYDTVIPMP